ncbi:MAG TPA: bifunctional diguanylate cyclase/phosphodiesterase [Gammaproteobacteria bacterium]
MASVATLPVGQKNSELAGIVTLYSDMPAYFEQVGTEFFDAFIHLANSSLDQCALLNDLTHLASHDLLTSLLNRRGIQEAMERELARSKRTDSPFSILLFDADRFKLINDRLGHKQGDLVLKSIALSAATGLRDEDYLARWGGEEFICLLPATSRDEAMLIAERMRNGIKSTSVSVASVEINMTASFGVASYPLDGTSIDKLIAAADAALYQAKRTGRDRSVSAHTVQEGVHSLCNTLDTALSEGRIVPAFQPIVDLKTGEVVAEETLARLVTDEGEVIPAINFIGAAHQLQMLHRIDESIIKQAFSHCVTGLETGTNRLNHFVNVSADLLRHRELVNELLAEALKSCCSCSDMIGPVKPMVIEITERELLDDIETAKELLMPFIDFGLRLALDDFGSGYSSYQYLADLPVSFLKIDGALIKRVQEPKVRAIVQGIQDTADALDIITLAEFVEDKETESILKEIGINWGQGYLYGKPEISRMQSHVKYKQPK